MESSHILNPYIKGLAEGANIEWHEEAVRLKTPSVEADVGMFLQFFAGSSKPSKILEIGCGIGVSTRYMACGAPDARITAIDYNKGRLEEAVRLSEKFDNIDFKFADGLEYARDLDEKFDLIFVDSVKRFYPIMFYHLYKNLASGGTIIFDDMFMYGNIFLQDCEIPEKYRRGVFTLREFINKIQHTYRHMLLPIGGGVMLVWKG